MLLRTLFVLMLLAALTETIVHGVHALAQTALRRQALAAVHDQILASTTSAREAIARAIAVGGDPRDPKPVPPSPSPACRLRARHGCALEGIATVSFDAGGSGEASPCPSAACTIYEQGNDAVDEGRITATIAAESTTTGGGVLASRTARVTFRTLRVGPYAVLAGQADESLEALAGPGRVGDDGGAAPTGSAPGTLIDVLFENAVTGTTIPANVWHSQVQSGNDATRAWSP
ncbi:MAG: hypothetical protein ABI231_10850 [Candidatus Tumulicola sp.]